ncbi:Coiled-coil domain-containing protein 13 [Eumeta japonica]|uniref:Coiled-coil domain-containing protein 13 n=1 Tax=Eumeta variegata TaxID=151549 RepID=A0A4C1ZC78_EUMVA|nr:Coiled-coil domain-containing protein 13 [Eumeta japonica]
MTEEYKPNDQTRELAIKIDETDEMKLKMLGGINLVEDNNVLYPAELNAHLLDQLQIMTKENTALRKCILTKDKEIKELNITVADLNNRIRDIITATGPAISCKSAGIISSKITELCKQNRHLVAENEKYKTKNAALERKIMQIEMSMKEKEKLELCKEQIVEASPDELKMLNAKLTAVNKKLCESKNRNLELKNDILIATKILQQEMGDKFTSIKELQNDLAGWKGRAQQIATLQSRVTELESKLNMKHKDLLDAKRRDQNQVIRDLEAKRKKEIEVAMKEIVSIKEENQDLKRKLDGAKARTRNLECEILSFKQKIQTYSEKSSNDDLLIKEQKNQIRNLELHYQEILNDNSYKMDTLSTKISEIEKEKDNANSKVEAILMQSSEKAAKIEELRHQLQKYEECALQKRFLFSYENCC